MVRVYLVIGVPGAGKTWVCEQLVDRFSYVARDSDWDRHLERLLKAAKSADRAVVSEVPFGESGLIEALKLAGIDVRCVYVVEPPLVLTERMRRRGKRLPTHGELKRARGHTEKAFNEHVFSGTSEEVLAHLRAVPVELLKS